MLDLTPQHPANLTAGACRVGQRIAKERGQTTLGIVCRDAGEYAVETRELVREIATDANHLIDEIARASADGVITADELRRIQGLAAEIREEAVTGRIVSPASTSA